MTTTTKYNNKDAKLWVNYSRQESSDRSKSSRIKSNKGSNKSKNKNLKRRRLSIKRR